MEKGRTYDISVQKCFYGVGRVVYSRISVYAKVETSEPYVEWESMARRWKNRTETLRANGEKSVFEIRERERVPRCFLQQAF